MPEYSKGFIPYLRADSVPHALFGGSSAKVWLNCHMAARLWSKQFHHSEVSSDAAKQGTALHTIMQELLWSKTPPEVRFAGKPQLRFPHIEPEDFLGCEIAVKGDMEPYIVEADDVEYLSFALEWAMINTATASHVFIERKVSPLPEADNMWGYVDVGALQPLPDKTMRLKSLDYKFGYQRVHADSEQLRYYGLAMIEALWQFMPKTAALVREVETIVIQPKLGWVDSRVYDLEDISDFKTEIALAYNAFKGTDDPEYTPGPWCANCRAARDCPALRQRMMDFPDEIAEFAFYDEFGEPNWQWWLDRAQTARIAAKRVEMTALDFLRKGGQIDGFKLIVAKRQTKWKGDAAARRELLARGVPLNALEKRKLVTPLELARLLPAIDTTDLVKERKEYTFAPVSDRRQAVPAPLVGFEDVPDFAEDGTEQ